MRRLIRSPHPRWVHRWRRALRALVPAAALLAALAGAAGAQERLTRRGEGLIFHYAPQDRALAAELWPLMQRDRAGIMGRLDLHPPGTLRVLLMPTREAFRQALRGMPPEQTLGVYLSETRTIVLRAPRTRLTGEWDVRGVMRHELAHGLLDLAIDRPIPRWLHEGLAILVADELSFLDDTRLTLAAMRGRLIPLQLLVHGFPAHLQGRELAYFQAASFARFLLRQSGLPGLRRMLDRLAAGASLDAALSRTYGLTLHALEERWREGLERSFSWLALITSTTVLGGLGVPLLLLGWARRRWQRHRQFRAWEREEAERDPFAFIPPRPYSARPPHRQEPLN